MSDLRSKLRDAANEDYELLKATLKEALDAGKPVQRKCEHCGRQNTFHIPDFQSRMKAVDTWISQGFGKPPNEEREQELDLNDVDVTLLSADDRAALRRSILRKYPALGDEIRSTIAKRDEQQQTADAHVLRRPRPARNGQP